jgi:hypothetical protein
MSYVTDEDESSVDKTASLKATHCDSPHARLLRRGQSVPQHNVRDPRSIDTAGNHTPDPVGVKL